MVLAHPGRALAELAFCIHSLVTRMLVKAFMAERVGFDLFINGLTLYLTDNPLPCKP
jgi:hypothetical protein